MRRFCAALAVAMVLASAAHSSVKSQIQDQYRRWARATMSNDVDSILRGLAPTYTLKTYTGKIIDRASYEKSLRLRKTQPPKPISAYTTHMASIAVTGPTAIVISEESSINKSVDPITQKQIRLVHIHQYRDTWTKSPQSWLLKSTVTQRELTKVERN